MESENNGNNSGRDEKGRFGAGNPGKPKGAASNASAKVKQAVVDFLERNTENIQDTFDKLKPADKLKFIADILPYATPKLSSIEADTNVNHSGGITISWQDPELPNTEDKGSS